jgi:uncharacterized protein YxjI
MRYIMKEKLFSWGDDFVIRDEQGRDAFQVDGKVLTFGKQLAVQDMAGNELAFIKQRVFSWGPSYEIYRAGALVAEVRKELFTFFQCKFTVDVPGPDDLLAEGDFFDHEYQFTRGGRMVAAISKQWFSWTDTYGVDVADDEDPILILAGAVVIDQVCHEERS